MIVGYEATTATWPSSRCAMCEAGIRRYLETKAGNGKIARRFVHAADLHAFVACEDQEIVKRKWGAR